MPSDSFSDEDSALFQKMMHGVKPLPQNKKAILSPARSIKSAPVHLKNKLEAAIAPPPSPSLYLSDYYYQEVQAETILSYHNPSIPKKRMQELKNGQIIWQAKLDLHGLNSDAAKEALIQFIIHQSQLEHRCLLIIHGKSGKKGEAPVLKNLINHWLPQFPQVIAFHSALPKQGGAGALYVLLKRIKPGIR